MATRKVLVVTDELTKSINNICNAALKQDGLQMVSIVDSIVDALKKLANTR